MTRRRVGVLAKDGTQPRAVCMTSRLLEYRIIQAKASASIRDSSSTSADDDASGIRAVMNTATGTSLVGASVHWSAGHHQLCHARHKRMVIPRLDPITARMGKSFEDGAWMLRHNRRNPKGKMITRMSHGESSVVTLYQ